MGKIVENQSIFALFFSTKNGKMKKKLEKKYYYDWRWSKSHRPNILTLAFCPDIPSDVKEWRNGLASNSQVTLLYSCPFG